MNKVLLVFPYKLKDNKEDFKKQINKFEYEGYDIVNFKGINKDFDIMSLPNYINYVNEQVDYELNRISVFSNVREFIFIWFRAYNGLVDDFIYFIDENYEDDFIQDNKLEDEFHKKIRDFYGVKNETNNGKIFINLNYENYDNLINFLLKNNFFRFFDHFDNYNYKRKQNKVTNFIKKKYKFNDYIFDTDELINIDNCNIQSVDLEFSRKKISLDKNLIELLVDNNYFIPYFLLEILRMIDINNIKGFLLTLFKNIKENDSIIDSVYSNLLDIIDKKLLNFKEKISLLSSLVIIKPEDEIISKKITKLLKKDQKNIDTHYAILTNLSFYKNVDKLKFHDSFYFDRRKIRDNILDHIKDKVNIKYNKNRNKKTIAIIAHQLLSMLHSPTKMLIKYINFLKDEYPEYNIKVFVEDNFVHKSSELFFPYAYSSAWAKNLNEEHLNELNDDIDIYYSDPQKSRKQRTINLVNEVNKFSPELVWAFGPLSIALDILYEYYPTIYIALNTDSFFVESADVHMYTDKTLVLEKNQRINLINKDNIYDRIVINLHEGIEPNRYITRKEYGLDKSDFIMITVGNRLDSELDSEFIDYIINFINSYEDIKWIILGNAKLDFLKYNYREIFETKIININYEKDLSALYQICDIYINPRRSTGGASAYIALNNNIPVLTLQETSDVSAILGLQNTVGPEMNDYINELEKIYNNDQYKKSIVKKQGEIIDNLNYKKGVEQFIEFFNIAKKKYAKRKVKFYEEYNIGWRQRNQIISSYKINFKTNFTDL